MGEGKNEEMFCKFLKLVRYSKGLSITIKNGRGGSPLHTIQACHKTVGDFDLRCAVIDNDKSAAEISAALKYATKYGIKVISNKPCLDATLLSIINPTTDYTHKTSAWCKKEFESKYLKSDDRHTPEKYIKIMPLKKLLNYGKVNLNFRQLLSVIEGSFKKSD